MNETTSKTYTVRTVDYYGNVEFHTFSAPGDVTEFFGEADMGHHTFEIEGCEFEGDWPTSEEMFDWYENEATQAAPVATPDKTFTPDAGSNYRPSSKQKDYAGKLAREIRDALAAKQGNYLGVPSAHSLSKEFTIDTLIDIRDAVRAGLNVEIKS